MEDFGSCDTHLLEDDVTFDSNTFGISFHFNPFLYYRLARISFKINKT